LPLRHHTVARPAGSIPPRHADLEVGAYIWWVDDEDADRDAAQPPAPDPHYAAHLDFVCHHPGFAQVVEELRKIPPPTIEELAEVAHRWRVSVGDLWSFVAPDDLVERKREAVEGEDVVELRPEDECVFVEGRPTAWVLHIPRPLTPARREAVQRWLAAERGWLDPLEREAGLDKRPNASVPAALLEGLPLFDRWNSGESIMAIWESVPSVRGRAPSEDNVRKTIRRVWERMCEICPDGVRTPGP